MSEQNKAAARAEFDVWSTGAIERLDDLVAPDVVHHDPYDPNAAGGLAGLKRTIELNRRAFPDMRLSVEDQVAEGDKVVTRWSGEMTHLGELGGAAPTATESRSRASRSSASRTGRSSRPGAAWTCSVSCEELGRSKAPEPRPRSGPDRRSGDCSLARGRAHPVCTLPAPVESQRPSGGSSTVKAAALQAPPNRLTRSGSKPGQVLPGGPRP